MSETTDTLRAAALTLLGEPDSPVRADDVPVFFYSVDQAIGAVVAALTATPAPSAHPVAHVEETLAGPRLYVFGVLVNHWLGCVHDAQAHDIAHRICAAAQPAQPEPWTHPLQSFPTAQAEPAIDPEQFLPAIMPSHSVYDPGRFGVAWSYESMREYALEAVQRVLSAQTQPTQAPSVPPGWVLVPESPHDAQPMIEAAILESGKPGSTEASAYRAMLAARPTPEVQAPSVLPVQHVSLGFHADTHP